MLNSYLQLSWAGTWPDGHKIQGYAGIGLGDTNYGKKRWIVQTSQTIYIKQAGLVRKLNKPEWLFASQSGKVLSKRLSFSPWICGLIPQEMNIYHSNLKFNDEFLSVFSPLKLEKGRSCYFMDKMIFSDLGWLFEVVLSYPRLLTSATTKYIRKNCWWIQGHYRMERSPWHLSRYGDCNINVLIFISFHHLYIWPGDELFLESLREHQRHKVGSFPVQCFKASEKTLIPSHRMGTNPVSTKLGYKTGTYFTDPSL